MTDFEQRLWNHLADEFNADDIDMPTVRTIASQTPQRRRRVTITAGLTAAVAAAAVALAVVLLIGATTATQPAYALVQHADGSVTVTVHNLRTAIQPINTHLSALGIPERFIPITDACPKSNGGFVYPVRPSQYPQLRWTFTRAGSRKMAPGDWGYIGIGRSDAGRLLLAGGAMKPPLPSCFNSTLGKIVSPSSSRSNLAVPQSGPYRPLLVQRARVA
jgi:hypothetical protein